MTKKQNNTPKDQFVDNNSTLEDISEEMAEEISEEARAYPSIDELTDEQLAFTSPQDRFKLVINLFKGLVIRYLRRHSERLVGSDGTINPACPSSEEILHAAGIKQDFSGFEWLNRHHYPTIEVVERELSRFRAMIEKRIEATCMLNRMDVMIPELIQTQFQLSAKEILLLCAIAAPQIEQTVARLYKFATGLDTTIFPGWFYAELLSDDEFTPQDILYLLEPEQPLRTYALVEAGYHADWGALTPVLDAPLSVPNRIASFLIGFETRSPIDYATIVHPKSLDFKLYFPDDFKKQVRQLLRHPKNRLAFFGPNGFGRQTVLREYCSHHDYNTLEIDLSLITEEESPRHLLSVAGLWFREARMNKAVMVFRCDNIRSQEVEHLLIQISDRFRVILDKHPGAVCIIAKSANTLINHLFGDYTILDCKTPARSEQYDLWRKALSPFLSNPQLNETANYISASYCLTMGEIKKTIDSCRARIGLKPITGIALSETLRTMRGQVLEGLADLKTTPLGLKDIVLNEKALNTIQEILNYARYSDFVSDDWGFSRMSSATGLSVLFSGPPGTGKTLTAGVLAHELKRALYVVDISRVVDKYIGETEKRLAKIFDEAQASQAILLFDEADSLFAKRTSVKSSNDRYANLEVNYLLQRLESYHGVTILTTNLADSLDDALARRIQFKIAFPMPDAKERANLWSVLLPQKAYSDDIDFDSLGEEFELSGGYIKNAVFRACINAASKHTKVTTDMLWDAAMHEYREMGHVVRDYQD